MELFELPSCTNGKVFARLNFLNMMPKNAFNSARSNYYYATAASLEGMQCLYAMLSTREAVPAGWKPLQRSFDTGCAVRVSGAGEVRMPDVTLPGSASGPGAVPALEGSVALRRFPPQLPCRHVAVSC